MPHTQPTRVRGLSMCEFRRFGTAHEVRSGTSCARGTPHARLRTPGGVVHVSYLHVYQCPVQCYGVLVPMLCMIGRQFVMTHNERFGARTVTEHPEATVTDEDPQ
eukprot:4936711-Alexandrium_andersonii.AAC.1